MELNQDIQRALKDLDRAGLQAVLESNGYAVRDSESDDDLREAIRQDLEAGIINAADLTCSRDRLPDPRDR